MVTMVFGSELRWRHPTLHGPECSGVFYCTPTGISRIEHSRIWFYTGDWFRSYIVLVNSFP